MAGGGGESVSEPGGAGPDAAPPSARWQEAEQFVAGVTGVFNNPVDGERGGVFFSLSLPVVHDQLLCFADVEREVVVLGTKTSGLWPYLCRPSQSRRWSGLWRPCHQQIGWWCWSCGCHGCGWPRSHGWAGSTGEDRARSPGGGRWWESGWRVWGCLSAQPGVCLSGRSGSNFRGWCWAQGLYAWWPAVRARCYWTVVSEQHSHICVPLVQVCRVREMAS